MRQLFNFGFMTINNKHLEFGKWKSTSRQTVNTAASKYCLRDNYKYRDDAKRTNCKQSKPVPVNVK